MSIAQSLNHGDTEIHKGNTTYIKWGGLGLWVVFSYSGTTYSVHKPGPRSDIFKRVRKFRKKAACEIQFRSCLAVKYGSA